MSELQDEQGGRAKEILVVEDDVDSAEMLSMLLEMEGYSVKWAPTGRALIRLLSSSGGTVPTALSADDAHAPDLILLDLTLPDMALDDIVTHLGPIRASLPPIIVMSALSQQAVEASATAIGAAGLATKPFDIDRLLRNIETVLAAR